MKYEIHYDDIAVLEDILKNGEGLTYIELCTKLKLNPIPSANSINTKNHIFLLLTYLIFKYIIYFAYHLQRSKHYRVCRRTFRRTN